MRHVAADDLVFEADLEPAERRLLAAVQRGAEREALQARRLLHACDLLVRDARSAARRNGRDPAAAEAMARELLNRDPALSAAAAQVITVWNAYRHALGTPLADIDLAAPLSSLGDVEAMTEYLRRPRGPRHTPPRRPRPEIESTLH